MADYKEEYVNINGILQYFLHYKKKDGAPVLLFLHGGPGFFEHLMAYKLDEAWGDCVTQVHWDQRAQDVPGRKIRQFRKIWSKCFQI